MPRITNPVTSEYMEPSRRHRAVLRHCQGRAWGFFLRSFCDDSPEPPQDGSSHFHCLLQEKPAVLVDQSRTCSLLYIPVYGLFFQYFQNKKYRCIGPCLTEDFCTAFIYLLILLQKKNFIVSFGPMHGRGLRVVKRMASSLGERLR